MAARTPAPFRSRHCGFAAAALLALCLLPSRPAQAQHSDLVCSIARASCLMTLGLARNSCQIYQQCVTQGAFTPKGVAETAQFGASQWAQDFAAAAGGDPAQTAAAVAAVTSGSVAGEWSILLNAQTQELVVTNLGASTDTALVLGLSPSGYLALSDPVLENVAPNTTVSVDVSALFPIVDPTSLLALSADGPGLDESGFDYANVPEPASAALLLFGLGAMRLARGRGRSPIAPGA